ncbi:MAG: nucleoside-diphosphate sugar epimerase/dehydratase [Candidatus Bathyarchaeia archaeon]
MNRAWLKSVQQKIGFAVADTAIIAGSLYLAFWLRFEGTIPPRYFDLLKSFIPIASGLKVFVFLLFRMYRFSWSYVGMKDLLNVALGCGTSSLALGALLFIFRNSALFTGFPRSVLAIDFAFTLLGVGGMRLSKRAMQLLFARKSVPQAAKRTLIIGAGDAGEQLLRSLQREQQPSYWPIGFLDDAPEKQGRLIHGVPILGPRNRLPALARKHKVDAVIIAMPSAHPRIIRETVELARQASIREVKILPNLSELYTGEIRFKNAREIRPEDVLPREPAVVDFSVLQNFLKGRKILITGAAGSIGSELCRQILRFSPEILFAVDFDETALFLLEQELNRLSPKENFKFFLADIRDSTKIFRIFEETKPQIVFHAAAYKHVPMLELFPDEAVKTNILGTKTVLEAACNNNTEVFVLISTDKAVNPVSVMGMTKRVAEMLTLAYADQSQTKCIIVRFGNVLGSRGSVIPIFLEQIRRGGPVTVTHPDMERYFMTISEAVLLVLQAAAMGKGGEVFVLDMGKPVKILDIAKELIRFHGLEPDKDIAIVFTGVRPGEKLKEEVLSAEEGTVATKHKQIYIARITKYLPKEILENKLNELLKLASQNVDNNKIKEALYKIIYSTEKNVCA